MDALVDCILAYSEETIEIKLVFTKTTVERLTNDPKPPLAELVRIFCRVLHVSRINNLLNLTLLEVVYVQFQPCKDLSVVSTIDLFHSTFNSLYKHELSNKNFNATMQEKWTHFLSRNVFSRINSALTN